MRKYILLLFFAPFILFSQIKTELIVDKEVYRLGEPIWFEIIMINDSKKMVIASLPQERNKNLYLFKENGERIKCFGVFFYSTNRKYIPVGELYPNDTLVMQPMVILQQSLLIHPWTRIREGEYYLIGVGAYTVPGSGDTMEVPSDTIRIKVIEPEGIDREAFDVLRKNNAEVDGKRGRYKDINWFKLAERYSNSVYAPIMWYFGIIQTQLWGKSGMSFEEYKDKVSKFLRLYKNSAFSVGFAEEMLIYGWSNADKVNSSKEWFMKEYNDGKWKREVENIFDRQIQKDRGINFKKRLERLKKMKEGK